MTLAHAHGAYKHRHVRTELAALFRNVLSMALAHAHSADKHRHVRAELAARVPRLARGNAVRHLLRVVLYVNQFSAISAGT